MTRRNFPDKIKLQAFHRANGKCEECGQKVLGRAQYDHVIPDALGGEPTLDNCRVLCSKCHRLKTSSVDVPAISKAKRIEMKRTGARTRHVWPTRKMRPETEKDYDT